MTEKVAVCIARVVAAGLIEIGTFFVAFLRVGVLFRLLIVTSP